MDLRGFPSTGLVVAVLVFLFSFASVQTAHAQRPSLKVTEIPCVGDTVTINYSNPSMAGKTVTIRIDNGMRRNTLRDSVTIKLDQNGNGTAKWKAPNWFGANFNAPGVTEVHQPFRLSCDEKSPLETISMVDLLQDLDDGQLEEFFSILVEP